ncbi:hypothetical protein [Streptomyces hokutonensis]|uniref:hypothetical protein n=1 Tax=Streptomyces hokutonensis TaxID=1306990 RepID=UPI0003778B4E|nr:hypothetical protein [Streptomyces hokutonensis]
MTTLSIQKGLDSGERLTAENHEVDSPRMVPFASRPRSEELTIEDIRLLLLLAEGHPAETIARILCTSGRTLRRRIRAVCDEIGVRTPIEAAVWAARRGLI